MQALLNSLVIETYSELAAVTGGLAALIALGVLFRRRLRSRGARPPGLIGPNPAAAPPPREATSSLAGKAKGMDFDRLADLIADASDRAGHISETQSAAALKLDTAEMAVNRLIADIDAVKTVPATARRAPSDGAVQAAAQRSTITA